MKTMFTLLVTFSVVLLTSVINAQPAYTVTTDIGAAQENWNTAAAWSFPAGFAPTENFPQTDFDEDGNTSTPLATSDHGAHLIIDVGDNIKIPNNLVIDLRNSRLQTITIKANAELHFGSNSQLQLPAGCKIIFETGARMIADSNSSGTYLEIGGNGVWGRECQDQGCNNSTQTGPGVIDENSTPGSPMPVDLLFFRAEANENIVDLHWATATEINASHFIIQRSLDGVSFEDIGDVSATGTSVQRVDYSYTDNTPIIGRTYYRLKEVDRDGKAETFNVVVVQSEGRKSISVYPNPHISSEALTVNVNFSSEETNYATLSDLAGHTVRKFSFAGTSYVFTENPGRGTYILNVVNGGKTYVTRFVVQ